jgi:hypothetical protein
MSVITLLRLEPLDRLLCSPFKTMSEMKQLGNDSRKGYSDRKRKTESVFLSNSSPMKLCELGSNLDLRFPSQRCL